MNDLQKLRESFFNEAYDLIEHADILLLELENKVDDMDLINAIFRDLHTLKGTCGIFEFNELKEFTHIQEDLLDKLRQKTIYVTPEIIDILFKSLDLNKLIVETYENDDQVSRTLYEETLVAIEGMLPESSDEDRVIEEELRTTDVDLDDGFVASLSKAERNKIKKLSEQNKRFYQIGISLNKYCLNQGIDPINLVKTLLYDGEVVSGRTKMKDIPKLEDFNCAMLYIEEVKVIYATNLSLDELNAIFEFALESGVVTTHMFTPLELKELFNIDIDPFWLEESLETDFLENNVSDDNLSVFIEETEENLKVLLPILKSLNSERNEDVYSKAQRIFHSIFGTAAIVGFTGLSRIAEYAESILISLIDGTVETSVEVHSALKNAGRKIKEIIEEVELEGSERALSHDKGLIEGSVSTKLGEILIEFGLIAEEQLNEALKKQHRTIGEIIVDEGMATKGSVDKAVEVQQSRGVVSHSRIRVGVDRIDNLVNLAGELVILQNMVQHNKTLHEVEDSMLHKSMTLMTKVTRSIQEEIMSLRMVPINETFHMLMRISRDVSKQEGKKVLVNIFGEDTELDKTVIDKIKDPLVHIIRNAIGHGLETPDIRAGAGKGETGTVEIKAYHKGGNIVIEITDDGKGMDKDKILQKAIEKGIVHDGERLEDSEILKLIFEPGFSMAEEVTDISGRGVGMDVVKKNIEALRGKIDIASEIGKGSLIRIKLPLTLAIIDGMVIRVGENNYILPTISIVESFRPKPEDVYTVQSTGEVVKVREDVLPLKRLHEVFDISGSRKDPSEAMVVTIEEEGRKGCILVDELVGQQQVVIKTLGDSFRGLKAISGSAILGDGRVGLILDAGGLLKI